MTKTNEKCSNPLGYFLVGVIIGIVALAMMVAILNTRRESQRRHFDLVQKLSGPYYSPYDDMDGGQTYILGTDGNGVRFIDYYDEGEHIYGNYLLKWTCEEKDGDVYVKISNREGEAAYTLKLEHEYTGTLVGEDGTRFLRNMPESMRRNLTE